MKTARRTSSFICWATRTLTGTVRPTNVDGGADADVFVFDTDHGAYSMEASLSYGVMGGAFTRNINIYGQPYAPAKSLTIDASNLRTFYTGDTFNPGELVVTATRAQRCGGVHLGRSLDLHRLRQRHHRHQDRDGLLPGCDRYV